MEATLIRTDKNGTKYYKGPRTCGRCGGRGGSDAWAATGWRCYECGGAGKVLATWKEYTPEYEAKLSARRAKRQAKRAEEEAARHDREVDGKRKEWLKREGFTEEGTTYLVLGNTYERKEEIKAAGGKYNPRLGWHIDHKIEGFDYLELSKDQSLDETYWAYDYKYDVDFSELKRQEEERLHPTVYTSRHQGEVNERLKGLKLTVTARRGFDGWMGHLTWMYGFKDADGNVYIWRTTKDIDIEDGDELRLLDVGDSVTLDGTVKDHDEYRGEQQTILTRCKIQEAA